MKILHIETGRHLYGGAQQVAFLLDGLAARGVENLLVCPPGAAIGQHFAGKPVRVIELPCGGDADIGFLFRLKRLLAVERPQLVHIHSRRGADLWGGLAAHRAHIPAVLSRRVDNPESRWLLNWKYGLYRRVITISQGIADVLLGQGVDAVKLRVVRSALDPRPWQAAESRSALAQAFQLPEAGLVLGIVAQLIERKGHAVLFDALARIADGGPQFTLIVFGQGPLRDALERRASALGLSERVRFAGFRQDLARWMGALDLLVHPAFAEGLGVSLLQASAAGVPIVACRAGGIPEAVRDGINGLLVAPGDTAALADAISQLLHDAARRKALGDAGRQLIASEFSVDVMVEGNLQVYRELLV
jgi:glycosyltransferase involved in cell wall biosynthesis